MTKNQWLKCTDPQEMLTYVMDKSSPRKLRLFGCACCRQVWHLIKDDVFKRAVETADQYADGQADKRMLEAAKKISGVTLSEASEKKGITGPAYNALGVAWSTTRNPESAAMYPLWVFDEKDEQAWQIALLHDIFGNPFRRRVAFRKSWITGDVAAIAQSIYAERRFKDMPVLADALEEAECSNKEILAHCRDGGVHARGCWVVDLILGKK